VVVVVLVEELVEEELEVEKLVVEEEAEPIIVDVIVEEVELLEVVGLLVVDNASKVVERSFASVVI